MKKYTKPEIEISVFATEDIITASTGIIPGTDPNEKKLGDYGFDYNDMT